LKRTANQEHQLKFVARVLRVARQLFTTLPTKYKFKLGHYPNSSCFDVFLRDIPPNELFEFTTAAVRWNVVSVPRRKIGGTVLRLFCQC
jgi:hypothetical protein